MFTLDEFCQQFLIKELQSANLKHDSLRSYPYSQRTISDPIPTAPYWPTPLIFDLEMIKTLRRYSATQEHYICALKKILGHHKIY